MKINRVESKARISEGKAIQLRASSDELRYVSSICCGKKSRSGNIFTKIIFAPWHLAKWTVLSAWSLLRITFFCCYRDSDSIDWKETKEIFDTIYTAVFPAEYGNYPTDRQKAFSKAFDELSSAAQERFREHICLELARRAGKKEGSEQSQWVNENRSKINFKKDYLENIASNEVVKAAVKAFQTEIDKKTKQ